MKKILLLLLLCSNAFAQKTISLTKSQIKDKIMGGWAGQTIGVTFGGPVEFRYNGTIINEYHPIPWFDGYLKKTMTQSAGLYDDLYMDLTFVDIMEREGLDAPVESHAKAYANAGYALWHANQVGRNNILNGMMPPTSGHWHNNPHADCIDYQIEADFAGLMSPGMPNTASKISDKIGHIMNYGDGWYGGVFIGACYTQAFLTNNIKTIVTEALKTIPKESEYYKCIADVIRWHKQYPTDWKKTWFELQEKWTQDVGCPDGVFAPYNIDAKLNSAYVVLGLLYGEGDYTKTIEITTRCGQDADCNPSSSAGILGTVLGYSKIPAFWKLGLKEAEDIDFKFTTISLSDVYEIGFKHALKNIELNGGKINGENVQILSQQPTAVRLEQSFEKCYPIDKQFVYKTLTDSYEFEFEGTGFVVRGNADKKEEVKDEFTFMMDVLVDDKPFETAKLTTAFHSRRHEHTWKYDLPKGKHKIKLILKNPSPEHTLWLSEILVYGDSPSDAGNQNIYRFGMPRK